MRATLRGALPRTLVLLLLPAAAGTASASCAQPPECQCDAAITKIPLQNPVADGDGAYGLFVDYHGNALCKDGALCVKDDLPTGLTCDPADPAYGPTSTVNPAWTCTCGGTLDSAGQGDSVRCCLKQHPLPTALTALPVIQIPVHASANAPDKVENCASIDQGFKGSFEDAVKDNDKSCVASVIAYPKVDLAIDKSHDGPVALGGSVVFHLGVSNVGMAPVTGFTVTDPLPAGFTFSGPSPTGWSCAASPAMPKTCQPQTVTCTYAGTLAPATSTVLDLPVQLGKKECPGVDHENCATVSAKGDVNAKNDTDCDPYCLDYSTHTTSGVADDFQLDMDMESPSPSPDLLSWIKSNYAVAGVRDYDDNGQNHYFGHTFTGLAPASGHAICGAKLTVAVHCNDLNDSLSLRFTGPTGPDPAWIWGLGFTQAPWSLVCDGSSSTTLALDLANLPPNGAYPTDFLSAMNTKGFLDVVVQDDSGVDYVSLDVTYCCE